MYLKESILKFAKPMIGLLLILTSSWVSAGSLTVDLYRSGNSSNPRMDNVRDKDVEKFQKNGETWVRGGKGGISTFSLAPSDPKNWWKISKGSSYPSDLKVHEDRSGHWAWTPTKDMPLDTYMQLLIRTHSSFSKLK